MPVTRFADEACVDVAVLFFRDGAVLRCAGRLSRRLCSRFVYFFTFCANAAGRVAAWLQHGRGGGVFIPSCRGRLPSGEAGKASGVHGGGDVLPGGRRQAGVLRCGRMSGRYVRRVGKVPCRVCPRRRPARILRGRCGKAASARGGRSAGRRNAAERRPPGVFRAAVPFMRQKERGENPARRRARRASFAAEEGQRRRGRRTGKGRGPYCGCFASSPFFIFWMVCVVE